MRRKPLRVGLFTMGALAVLGGGCRPGAASPAGVAHGASATSSASPAPAASDEKVATIVAVSEVRGTPEPCGCQSDPVGDVARVAELVRAATTKGGALLVDAGGLRYSAEPVSKEKQNQAELKAQFLEQAWQDQGAVVGLGDEDLAYGPSRVPGGRRVCSNVAGLPLRPPVLRDLGGVKVGVFAVLDPEKANNASWQKWGLVLTDPTTAARAAVASLKADGAQVIVALAHLGRPAARRLARDVGGLTVVVAGDEIGDDGAEPEQVGETILVQPANEAQKAARVELHVVSGKVSAIMFAGAEERARDLERLNKKIDQVGQDIERLVADPKADPGFIATKRAEAKRLRGDRERLASASPTPPPGSYALAQLIAVRRKIPRDEKLAASMKALDAKVGEANRAAGEKVPPPAAGAGEPRFVGDDDCESCHEKAVAFWKKTVHARAWQELVDVNKQWSYDCISCHVTGYGQRGGSSMGHVENLTSVQCEVCHGPGSKHSDEPKKVKLTSAVEADCRECHTKEHSDTFQYEAYLRDILGPGHGEKQRQKLGAGPTGHDLRHGAIERAKEK